MDPEQIMSRLRALASSFSAAQIVSLGLAFVLVVGIVAGSAWWVGAPTYVLLFSDMDPETAGEVVTRLKTLKVSYQLDEGGRAVRVPMNRVDELRLELTSQGLPSSGRVGFELFDRTAFGVTEFLEQVNYRRALEGEIARTIATLTEVSSARVHIAMGKETLFGEPRPAKASVVLKLRGQRTLAASTIAGIGNLVAASVEGLRPDAVVILDSFGRALARPSEGLDVAGAAGQLERQQRLEREMGARVVALLEPVVGAERVRVNVALRLNPATVEQTEERFDPTNVVRSRQVTANSSSATPAGGVAGSRGNVPPDPPDPKDPAPAQAPAAQAAAALLAAGMGSSQTTETTNFEVSRTTVVRQTPAGEVARMSVAVIVDDEQVAGQGDDGATTVTRRPRTPEELQKIQGLVAAAVGFEAERGDHLTVQNISFEEPVADAPIPLTTIERVQHYAPQIWEGARLLVAGVLGVIALFFFVRPLMQRIGSAAPGGLATPAARALAGGEPLRTVSDLEQEIEAQLEASAAQRADSRRLPVLVRRASAIGAKEPENVAKLLSSWISEGER
jgi:flagellar M-ring protein FliF